MLKARSAGWLRSLSGISRTTESAMGSIISAVAVLLTHMLRKADATRKPAMIRLGFTPMWAIRLIAMRRWRFHRSMARAMRKPARKR